MSHSKYDEAAQAMREAQNELKRTLRKLADATARLAELERDRGDDSGMAGTLIVMNKSTKQLLAAINTNTKTTNDLLKISGA